MWRSRFLFVWALLFAAPLALVPSPVMATDFAAANETIWPSQNDVAQTAGDGKKLLENQWGTLLNGLTTNQYAVVSGLTLPASSGTLNIDVASGTAIIEGRHISIPASTTVTATFSATNYVFLKLTRDGSNLVTGAAFEVNTTGTAPTDSLAVGTLVAGASSITSTTDTRLFFRTGIVEMFSGAEAAIPVGAILADGRAVSRTTYPNLNALYARAGYPYGSGDGSTTFNVPDLRDRIPLGKGDMGGTAADRVTSASTGGANSDTLGGAGGAQTHTLSVSEMPAHTHSITDGLVPDPSTYSAIASAGYVRGNDTTGSTGGGGAHNITQPWLAVNYIVWN